MSAIIRREPFANALEGQALPGGEYVVGLPEPAVSTDQGRITAPDIIRYPVLTVGTARGRCIAGQAQNSGATWEYVEAEGKWFNRGPNAGERPVCYLPDGTLVIEPGGPDHPTEGWAGTGLDGQPARIVRYDGVRDIHEVTELGPFDIGQSSIDGIELQFDGQRYQLEPGNVHTIWAVLGADGVLAVATRKLEPQNETVLLWVDVNRLAELPPAPVKPPTKPPVEPPKPPKPPIPPKEPPVTDQQNPLPAFIAALLPAWLAKYPVPQIRDGEGDDSFTERMRQWMLPLHEQIEYLAPGKGYGRKRGDPGRPWGKDTIPYVTRLGDQWGGHAIVEGEGWDLFIGTSAGHPSFNPNVRSVNLAGQYFETVAAIDHMGAGAPGEPPKPPDGPAVDLDARLKAIEARLAGIDAVLADGANLNAEQWAAIRELQNKPGGGTVDLSGYAKKGDRVTVSGRLPLVGNVTAHGAIDQ